MKSPIAIAALAVSLLAAPAVALAQQPHHHGYRGPAHVQKHVVVKKKVVVRQPRWVAGRTLPSSYRRHVVSDYHRYHLRTPGRGQRWVRVDNQFILINSITGVIAALIAAS